MIHSVGWRTHELKGLAEKFIWALGHSRTDNVCNSDIQALIDIENLLSTAQHCQDKLERSCLHRSPHSIFRTIDEHANRKKSCP